MGPSHDQSFSKASVSALKGFKMPQSVGPSSKGSSHLDKAHSKWSKVQISLTFKCCSSRLSNISQDYRKSRKVFVVNGQI